MPSTVILWMIIYATFLWLCFYKHPSWGLGSYLLTLYAAPDHHWYGVYIPDLRWSLIAAFVILISTWMNWGRLTPKNPWYKSGIAKLLLAYTIWMWIQFPWAISSEWHLFGCVLFTKYIILFFLIYSVIDTDTRIFFFLLFNILGGFYWGYLIKITTGSGRVEWVGGPGISDSNTMGMHLGIVCIFASLMLLKKNTIFQKRIWWWITQGVIFLSALLMANGIVQSISRSAMVGFAFAGMVLFYLNHKAYRWKFLLFAIIASLGFVYFSPQTFWNRMDTVRGAVEGEEIEASAYSRIIIAKAQIEMFKENVMGHGFRGTAVLSPYYMESWMLSEGRRSSHNTFLTAMVEQGIPGAIMYWLAVLLVIKTILSFKKDDITIYLYVMMIAGGLAALFAAGMFVDYLKAEIMIYCFAILASLKEIEKRKEFERLHQTG